MATMESQPSQILYDAGFSTILRARAIRSANAGLSFFFGFFMDTPCKIGGRPLRSRPDLVQMPGTGLRRLGGGDPVGGSAFEVGRLVLVDHAFFRGFVHRGSELAHCGINRLGIAGFDGADHLAAQRFDAAFGGSVALGAAFGLAVSFEGGLRVGQDL